MDGRHPGGAGHDAGRSAAARRCAPARRRGWQAARIPTPQLALANERPSAERCARAVSAGQGHRGPRSSATAKIPHAIGGALALAYYAEPRATIDIDLNVFVPPERWEEVVGALARSASTPGSSTPPPCCATGSAGSGGVRTRSTSSSPTTRSTRRCASRPGACPSPTRPSPSWPRSTSPSARRCSTGPRTGWTSSRCSLATDGLDVAEIEHWLERHGRPRRSPPEAPGRSCNRARARSRCPGRACRAASAWL